MCLSRKLQSGALLQAGGLRSWKERKPLAAEGWRQILASSSPPQPPSKKKKSRRSKTHHGERFFFLSSLPPGDHGTAAQSSRLIPVRSFAISESVCCDKFPSVKRIEGIPPMHRYLLSPLFFSPSSHPPPLTPCVPMRAVSFHARIGPSAPSTTPACSVRKSCT